MLLFCTGVGVPNCHNNLVQSLCTVGLGHVSYSLGTSFKRIFTIIFLSSSLCFDYGVSPYDPSYATVLQSDFIQRQLKCLTSFNALYKDFNWKPKAHTSPMPVERAPVKAVGLVNKKTFYAYNTVCRLKKWWQSISEISGIVFKDFIFWIEN